MKQILMSNGYWLESVYYIGIVQDYYPFLIKEMKNSIFLLIKTDVGYLR